MCHSPESPRPATSFSPAPSVLAPLKLPPSSPATKRAAGITRPGNSLPLTLTEVLCSCFWHKTLINCTHVQNPVPLLKQFSVYGHLIFTTSPRSLRTKLRIRFVWHGIRSLVKVTAGEGQRKQSMGAAMGSTLGAEGWLQLTDAYITLALCQRLF